LIEIFLFDIAADEEELVNDPLWLLDLSLGSRRPPLGEWGEPSPSSPLFGCEIFLLCEVSSPSIFPTTKQPNKPPNLFYSLSCAQFFAARGAPANFPRAEKGETPKASTHQTRRPTHWATVITPSALCTPPGEHTRHTRPGHDTGDNLYNVLFSFLFSFLLL
jgi:hypothetical protein